MVPYIRSRFGWVAVLCMLTPLFCAAQQAAPDSAGDQAPVFLSFKAPGSMATFPQSINDLMVVTGYYNITFEATRGFVRYADGSITTFVVPESQSTFPVSINHAGDITGYYIVQGELGLVAHGFIRAADGTITTFGKRLSAGNTQPFLPVPIAINDFGEVAGNVDSLGDNSSSIPFTRSPSGGISEFSLGPGSTTTTKITGMNASGAIIGYTSSNPPRGVRLPPPRFSMVRERRSPIPRLGCHHSDYCRPEPAYNPHSH